MSNSFEQISLKHGFMKHNGGVMFRNISESEYEFKAVINKNHLNIKNLIGAPARSRTQNLLVRSQALYPVELQALF